MSIFEGPPGLGGSELPFKARTKFWDEDRNESIRPDSRTRQEILQSRRTEDGWELPFGAARSRIIIYWASNYNHNNHILESLFLTL